MLVFWHLFFLSKNVPFLYPIEKAVLWLLEMDKLKKALSGDDVDEEQGIMHQMVDASTLSWSTRIKGFIICFVLGFVFSILGSACIALPRGMILFGIFYSLGNITALCSTMFLMGPLNQLQKMFAPTRVLATIAVLGFLVLTLCAGFWWKKIGLVIIFCILQFIAMTWYSISYIPYARNAVLKFFQSCMS
ncbi:vesicle transport protein SFT2A [Trichonephila clavata]|uniref:Vesicle transport protein n=1 Tax=Trichonephila clavata TaxID=2740835 RepID=A0A8X6HCL4_TRICU|nr:vesicle transport protein SFT2A [Trichonephila clavata]